MSREIKGKFAEWRRAAPLALLVMMVATAGDAALSAPQQSQSGAPPAPPAASTPQAVTGTSGGDQGPQRFKTHTEEVLVPVMVRDGSGTAVFDLEKKDFRIFEDDVEQRVTYFSNDAFPLSVVFLVDSDLPQRTADMVDQSLGAVLGGMAESDELAVVLFSQFPRTVMDFDSNQNQISDILKRTDLGRHFPGQGSRTMTEPPRPTTGSQDAGVPQQAKILGKVSKDLDDAVMYCAEMLRTRGRDRRKLVLLVSDGHNSHNNQASFTEVLRIVLANDISLYGIGVSEAVLDRKRSAILRYADATGGDMFYAPTRGGLEDDYTRILEEARNLYTLSYAPQGTDRSKEFHSIEVRVKRPGLHVLARDGYYVLQPKK
ncbi:MAG TPA: VWA domain-containing protein [Candidatus Binatia bacterium]|nr:VWA domain-containing protein [Candidatus Binatia bacterium]